MVEKRRRNRINYALDQLKMMVLEGLDKDVSFILQCAILVISIKSVRFLSIDVNLGLNTAAFVFQLIGIKL